MVAKTNKTQPSRAARPSAGASTSAAAVQAAGLTVDEPMDVSPQAAIGGAWQRAPAGVNRPKTASTSRAKDTEAVVRTIGSGLDAVLEAIKGFTAKQRQQILISAAAIEGLVTKPVSLVTGDAVAAQVATARKEVKAPVVIPESTTSKKRAATSPSASQPEAKRTPSPYKDDPVIGVLDTLHRGYNALIVRGPDNLVVGNELQSSIVKAVQTVRAAEKVRKSHLREFGLGKVPVERTNASQEVIANAQSFLVLCEQARREGSTAAPVTGRNTAATTTA